MGERGVKTPPTVVRRIRKLRREGFSFRSIAVIVGVDPATVNKYLNHAPLEEPPASRRERTPTPPPRN